MESIFERVAASQSYFAASIAAFKRVFYPSRQTNCAKSIVVAPTIECPPALDHQNIYQDPDPPTPHWGC
jgi:hypothetical protein